MECFFEGVVYAFGTWAVIYMIRDARRLNRETEQIYQDLWELGASLEMERPWPRF